MKINLMSNLPVKTAFLLIAWTSMVSTSSAIDAAYIGAWSRSAGKCDPDEVFRITRQGMSGHEFACTTKRSSREENGWRLRLSCNGEGDSYTLNVRWHLLQNGRLREESKGKVVEYGRCSGIAGSQSQPAAIDTPFGRVTPKQFSLKCVECFNEAQQRGRSIGGYCPVGCVDVFEKMVCDNQGRCRAWP